MAEFFMRKNESLEEMVTRRNKRLKGLFSRFGINVRLVGDDNKPAVIKDEQIVLSCYVKNFDLHFTKEPFSDEIIKTVKLKQEPEITKFELLEVLELCVHRPVFKVKLESSDLSVSYTHLRAHETD